MWKIGILTKNTQNSLFWLKGALDKYNIYLFISNSIEDFKLESILKFSADSANAFSFYEVWIIIFSVSHRLLYCIFIEVDFEKLPDFF